MLLKISLFKLLNNKLFFKLKTIFLFSDILKPKNNRFIQVSAFKFFIGNSFERLKVGFEGHSIYIIR